LLIEAIGKHVGSAMAWMRQKLGGQ